MTSWTNLILTSWKSEFQSDEIWPPDHEYYHSNCRPYFIKLKTAFTFIWNKIQTLQITLIFNLCNLTFVELEKEVWAKKTKLFSNTSEDSTFKISKISDKTKSIFFSFLYSNSILLFLCKVHWTLDAKTQMNIKGFLQRTVSSKIAVFMIFFSFLSFSKLILIDLFLS